MIEPVANPVAATRHPKHKRYRPLSWYEARDFYLFMLVWLIGWPCLRLLPMLASLGISMTRWNILESPKWIGLANYAKILTDDELFWQALKVTFIYTLSVPLRMAFALLLAVMLNQKVKGLALFRTIYYLPAVVGGVASSVVWIWIFNPNMGVLNYLLELVSIQGPNWLRSETWVIPSFMIMSLWRVGGSMVIYLAGLQGVPTALYEAAKIDGANAVQRFISVTLPMISPVIFYNVVMAVIGSFQVFTAGYVMTNGGPHNASLFYVLYLYRHAFQFFRMGYASALAWVLFVIILIFTLSIIKSSPMWTFYEGEMRGK